MQWAGHQLVEALYTGGKITTDVIDINNDVLEKPRAAQNKSLGGIIGHTNVLRK